MKQDHTPIMIRKEDRERLKRLAERERRSMARQLAYLLDQVERQEKEQAEETPEPVIGTA